MFAPIGLGPGVLARMMLVAFEVLGALDFGYMRISGDSEREHQLFGTQRKRLTFALHLDNPLLFGLIKMSRTRKG